MDWASVVSLAAHLQRQPCVERLRRWNCSSLERRDRQVCRSLLDSVSPGRVFFDSSWINCVVKLHGVRLDLGQPVADAHRGATRPRVASGLRPSRSKEPHVSGVDPHGRRGSRRHRS